MPSLELGGVLGTVTPRSLYKLPVLWYSVCVPPVPGSRAHVTHDTWTPEHCALNTETGGAGGGREPGASVPHGMGASARSAGL